VCTRGAATLGHTATEQHACKVRVSLGMYVGLAEASMAVKKLSFLNTSVTTAVVAYWHLSNFHCLSDARAYQLAHV
jgi:hypothetical protein